MRIKVFLASLVGLVLFLVALLLPVRPAEVSAAPPAAPTPITNPGYSPDGNFFVLLDNKTFAADGYSDYITLAGFEYADFQHVIDHGTVNTTTLTLQYSNDAETWITGPNLVANSAADGQDLTRFPLFGRYVRLFVNVSTTDTIRIDANLLAK